MKYGKRWLALLLAAVTLFTCAAAEEPEAPQEEPGAWPELNAEGFLDEGEFVYEGPENDLWRYCSQTLKIEIRRKSETDPAKLVWFEAEVWSRKEIFGFVTWLPGNHFTKGNYPYRVCGKNGAVLAINGDYASNRWRYRNDKKNQKNVGILLRDGEIFCTHTKDSGNTSFPNLDTLSTYADGTLEVHDSKELTAEEYQAKGAIDVLAFGPWLIRDGEVNPNLPKFRVWCEPRTAIGMIEPGHYIAFVAEGRHKRSTGITLHYMTEKLQALGCKTAFNMDGGRTSCIVFMGKQLNTIGDYNNPDENKNRKGRAEPEFFAIGTSTLVEGYEPPETGENP